jgi:hypothetical protein
VPENCETERELVAMAQEDLLKQLHRYKTLCDETALWEGIHARVAALTKSAVGRKELAEFTLHAFEIDLLSAQKSLRVQTTNLVSVRHAMNLAIAKKKAEEWAHWKQARDHQLKVAAASLVQDAKKKFLQARDRRQQRDRDKRIASAETQLNRLAAATGLQNPCSEVHELVRKYEHREELSRDLKASSTKLLARLNSRQQELSALEVQLQKLTHSSDGALPWRVLDDKALELEIARSKCSFKSDLLLGEIMQCHELMTGFDLRFHRMDQVAHQGRPEGSSLELPKDAVQWRRSLWGEEDHPWVPTPERVAGDEVLQSFERFALLALTMQWQLAS